MAKQRESQSDLQALIELVSTNNKTTQETIHTMQRAILVKVDSEFFVLNENQKIMKEEMTQIKDELRKHNGRLSKCEIKILDMASVTDKAKEHMEVEIPSQTPVKIFIWMAKNWTWVWIPIVLFIFTLILIGIKAVQTGWLPII